MAGFAKKKLIADLEHFWKSI